MNRSGRRWLVFFFATLGSYFLYFIYWNKAAAQDWNYFNGLSLFVRSAVFKYHRFPVHIPWACGGLDVLVNPQNRIFSPMGLLDLVLPVQLANLASLVILGFVGMMGMYRLLRELNVSVAIAMSGAALFINSGWFGLHYMEGHIPFGSMQLIPWVVWCWLRLPSRRTMALLALLFTFFLLDGAIYALIFSLLFLTGLFLTTEKRVERLRSLASEWRYLALCACAAAALSAPKWLPVLIGVRKKIPSLELESLSLPLLVRSFFYPFQAILSPVDFGVYYHWHEYGCYLGIVAVLIVLGSAICRWRFLDRRFVWLALFWFWVSSGWGYQINPWVLFQRLPLLNLAHVQSRCFILLFLCFIVLLCQSLEQWRRYPRLLAAVVVFLLAESFVVRNYPVLSLAESQRGTMGFSDTIQSEIVAVTLDHAWSPYDHYRNRDVGCKLCYEPAATPSAVSSTEQLDYHGEIYVTKGTGEARLVKYLPGEIELTYRLTEPGVIGLNTNALYGWKAEGGEVAEQSNGLLAVKTKGKEGKIRLMYQPYYFYPALLLFIAGLGLCVPVVRGLRPRKKHGPGFNYDSIPAGFYQQVVDEGSPIRRTWHLQKFERIIDCLPDSEGLSILDVGCFAGTFLSLLPREKFSYQLGVDILEKQIAYASERFGTSFREFKYIPTIAGIRDLERKFDCITLIEVIEHLTAQEGAELLALLTDKLKPGGRLVVSTPNYVSAWPIIEWMLNHLSDVSYEEQHLTRFNYFNAERKMLSLHPSLKGKLTREIKTTTHFISPFLAAISEKGARAISRRVPHKTWRFPFGNLVMLTFRRV